VESIGARFGRVRVLRMKAQHHGPGARYTLITSVESGPALKKWSESQLP
jgi:hypothetical protein